MMHIYIKISFYGPWVAIKGKHKKLVLYIYLDKYLLASSLKQNRKKNITIKYTLNIYTHTHIYIIQVNKECYRKVTRKKISRPWCYLLIFTEVNYLMQTLSVYVNWDRKADRDVNEQDVNCYSVYRGYIAKLVWR